MPRSSGRLRPLRLEGPDDARGLRRHDRLGQDRPLRGRDRGGRARRRARDRHRPQGRPRQPDADVPGAAPEDFRPWINEDDAAKAGVSPDDYAKAQAELWTKGLGDWGQDGARIQRLRDAADFAIYTPGSDAGLPVSVLGSFAPPADRSDAEARRRSDRRDRDRPAGAARHRRRPDQEPRAHPALEHPRRGLGQRPGARHPRADRADPAAAVRQDRRARPRLLLPAEGPLRARDGAQQPARRAGLPALDAGRAARRRAPAAQRRRQAAGRDLLDRAPLGRRAHVLRDAAPERRAGLDARPVGHDQPARARLHGRDLRLLPADRRAALQEAAADAAQAGARVRRGRAAGDAEPGRPRLQGPLERRHVADRPAADRPGQAARARRPRGRVRPERARPRRSSRS